ncbi:hypothetical protein BCR37DRAFT_375956 [Protomyces lactucae-debilis]|uniref:SAC3/GANP/Nin1/mts3/eIF-3 p25 family-domain-containing protein n=1 Tax=Protomyces lactucae-debilis TaxID=2754530 RepID=A0A1Y2FZB4_PROLT|nr:uncharacterized protein BCR37DRAFT_375956 [Protomyces lactucae-debilis]ORY87975.1 hypothetical protein BCR37DRAFT_375956 [Protomyces lactucae-debilis]
MSRLKAARTEGYGYVSRVDGDQRLMVHETQETFFDELCAKYELKSLQDAATLGWLKLVNADPKLPVLEKYILASEDSDCLSSLRGLREGIVASGRKDAFTTDVFERIALFSIMRDHVESYRPSVKYLLDQLYPKLDLLESENAQHVRRWYLLHLVCVTGDFPELYRCRLDMRADSGLADLVLGCLLHGNYARWHKLYNTQANAVEQRLMSRSYDRISKHTLGVLGAAYMSASTTWVEDLVQNQDLIVEHAQEYGWTVEGDRLNTRRPKKIVA